MSLDTWGQTKTFGSGPGKLSWGAQYISYACPLTHNNKNLDYPKVDEIKEEYEAEMMLTPTTTTLQHTTLPAEQISHAEAAADAMVLGPHD